MSAEPRTERPSGELLLVWGLFALAALAVFVTYARVPADELYHVSHEGIQGGLGRTLVLLNFPIALAAIGVVGVLLERGAPRVAGAVAIALCAVTAWPGVVDQDDLDARLVNVVPAAGVALAALLTARSRPRLALAPARRLDGVRVAIAIVVVIGSIPWLLAEAGFYGPNPILADEIPPGEQIAAVHLGHHHGTDGALLALCALLLSRVARSVGLRAYVALMFVYGLANALQDFWLEQLVKRGTVDVEVPSVLVPELAPRWGVLLLAAAAVYVLSREPQAG
jgi:hypothetical protein